MFRSTWIHKFSLYLDISVLSSERGGNEIFFIEAFSRICGYLNKCSEESANNPIDALQITNKINYKIFSTGLSYYITWIISVKGTALVAMGKTQPTIDNLISIRLWSCICKHSQLFNLTAKGKLKNHKNARTDQLYKGNCMQSKQ